MVFLLDHIYKGIYRDMQYNKINLFIPTYKRVANGKLPRLLKSIEDTASNLSQVVTSFLINDNDKETLDYIRGYSFKHYNCRYLTAEGNGPDLSAYYNRLYKLTSSYGENTLISMIGDDMYWTTKGWDNVILDKANSTNGICLIYCNDGGRHGKKLCVNLFTTRTLVRATGLDFMMPGVRMNVIDSAWMDLAINAKIAYYIESQVLYHDHNSLHISAKRDDTYRRLRKFLTFAPKHKKAIRERTKIAIGNLRRKKLIDV